MLVPLYFIHDHAYNFKRKIQWSMGDEKNKYDIALVDLTSQIQNFGTKIRQNCLCAFEKAILDLFQYIKS